MPIPHGDITKSTIWTGEPAPQVEEALAEECPCFMGGTCPTNGRHKDDL